ncbi:MAG: hemK [Rickettsiaceae bacterium]|jgi:release factor glutamine methyltransferase|nr:hemK [Rickettsiaceae bacterium]
MITIKEALLHGSKRLKNFSQSANLDSRIILGFLLNYSIEDLIKYSDMSLSDELFTKFNLLLDHRITGVPIAYLTGEKEFFGRKFNVNPDVLIPRADTEILIEAVLNDYGKTPTPLKLLELGVGSGCIIITLLLELQNAAGIAVDINANAVKIAKENASKYHLKDSLNIIQSNWFSNIADRKYDIIISNPPYISEEEKEFIAHETLMFEPQVALFAEDQGLINYKHIALGAKNFLKPNGRVYLEIGFRQNDAVIQIFTNQGYKLINTHKDLAGHDRVVCFEIK